MDAFLRDWEGERWDDERLWVVTPVARPREIAAYYAVVPDPLDIVAGQVSPPADGLIRLTGLATARTYEGQGLGTALLLRLFRQLADLEVGSIDWMIGEALDEDAVGFYLSRGIGFARLGKRPSKRVGVTIESIREVMKQVPRVGLPDDALL